MNDILIIPNTGDIGDVKIIPYGIHLSTFIDVLVHMDHICLSEISPWEKENFTLVLPDKSKLSKLAVINGELCGYIVCSSYQSRKKCHIHRLAVHPNYRRKEIAVKLIMRCAKECVNLNIGIVTVELQRNNIAAEKLYTVCGFKSIKGSNLINYLALKGKSAKTSRFDENGGTLVYSAEVKDLYTRLVK